MSQTQHPTVLSSVPEAPKQDEVLEFTFDTNGATFERSGDDLIIIFNDGNQIVLYDFYVEDAEGPELPGLHLTEAFAPGAGAVLTLESLLDTSETELFPESALAHQALPLEQEDCLPSAESDATLDCGPLTAMGTASFIPDHDGSAHDQFLLLRLELGVL